MRREESQDEAISTIEYNTPAEARVNVIAGSIAEMRGNRYEHTHTKR